MSRYKIDIKNTDQENANRVDLLNELKKTPIPDDELLDNLPLFLPRINLTQILYFNDLYKKILRIHGNILEFGTRWGRNLSLFESLRGIYEPYNYTRKIIGFDTFEGFLTPDIKDGDSDIVQSGAYSVTENYKETLEQILTCHENQSPISAVKKFALYKGDATVSIRKYLEEHPETIIAFANFDMDLYEPTKKCLEAILPHLTKGSIISFDELNHPDFPGETLALKEVLGTGGYRICHSPYGTYPGYIIIE